MWNETRIKELLDANPKAVMRAIVTIYERQTEDEKHSHTTKNRNGVGFGAFDAEFMTSLALQIKNGRGLSDRQLVIGRNKIKRYHRQLCEVANAKAAVKPVIEAAHECTCEDYDGEMLCPGCQVARGVHPDVAYGNAVGYAEMKSELAHSDNW